MPTPITSDVVFNMVESIASESSKNAKVDLVTSFAKHELFKRTLIYTLNPFITYNIRPDDPTLTSNYLLGGSYFDDQTWKLLDDLNACNITGNAAIEAVNNEFGRLTPESSKLLWRIINKDFRAGFSESTANKAVKDLIPEFPYMRCCLPKDAKLTAFSWVEGVYSQEKADGMFANVSFEAPGNVRITSRNGTPYPFEPFKYFVASVEDDLEPGYQYHGELLVQKGGKILAREIGNGILNSIQQGGSFEPDEKPIYKVWDRIELSSVVPKGKDSHPYKMRFAGLKNLVDQAKSDYIQLIETRIVHSLAEAYKHYGEMLALGREGTIIKDGNAIWRDGTSKQQVKLKLEAECDLMIVGFTDGKGKNKSLFGSVVVQTSDGLLEVGVSGFSDKKRKEINDKRKELLSTILTVRFNDIMYPSEEGKLHSLFLPRAVEFRLDKSEADNLQRVIDQLEAAKQAHIS